MVIIMLAAAYFETTTIVAIVAFFALCKYIARGRKSKLTLHYCKENKLYKEFVEKSNITQLSYEPYLFAPTPGPQGIFYLFAEEFYKYFYHDKFEREVIKCHDGGTIGLDWDGGIPDPSVYPNYPILVICPGLGGDSHNLYSL